MTEREPSPLMSSRLLTVRKERKKEFIHQLALFLTTCQSAKSVMLESERMRSGSRVKYMPQLATEWAVLRKATPLQGVVDYDTAVRILSDFLA